MSLDNYPDGVTHNDVLAPEPEAYCCECGEEIQDYEEHTNRVEGEDLCLNCALTTLIVRVHELKRELENCRKRQREMTK